MNDSPPPPQPPSLGALERARAVQQALADAARRARFSSRARGAHQRTSFEARRGAKTMRMAFLALLVLVVALPNLAAALYYGLMASPQYVSEAKFTVSSGAIPKLDGLGTVTGVPPMLIFQDTQAVVNYIESRAVVEALEQRVKLRDLYGSDDFDYWARFNPSKSIEKFTEYWKKMTHATILLPAGIVSLDVRAFRPDDARRIAETVIDLCETLVNGLNERMRRDLVEASELDLKKSAQRLTEARLKMERARNAEGLLDVKQASTSLNTLLAGLEGELLTAERNYATQRGYVSETAPQMRVLQSRIEAMKAQVDELKRKVTLQEQASVAGVADRALSGKITTFANLDLEQRIAEKRYAAAAASLEAARVLSERKMLYLHRIVAPATPEDARYPKRWTMVGVVLLLSVLAYLVIIGLVTVARNHMA